MYFVILSLKFELSRLSEVYNISSGTNLIMLDKRYTLVIAIYVW